MERCTRLRRALAVSAASVRGLGAPLVTARSFGSSRAASRAALRESPRSRCESCAGLGWGGCDAIRVPVIDHHVNDATTRDTQRAGARSAVARPPSGRRGHGGSGHGGADLRGEQQRDGVLHGIEAERRERGCRPVRGPVRL